MERIGKRLTRDELIDAFKKMAEVHGERLGVLSFCEAMRMSQRQIYRHFRSVRDLRSAAGLRTAQAPIGKRFSQSELLDDYRRVTRQLGRWPSEAEFDRLGKCCYATLRARFGGVVKLRRAATVADECDAAREQFPDEPLFTQSSSPGLPPAWDADFVRHLWERIRLRFTPLSSDLTRSPDFDFDLVICFRHDWPQCPVPVLDIRGFVNKAPVPRRATEPAEQTVI